MTIARLTYVLKGKLPARVCLTIIGTEGQRRAPGVEHGHEPEPGPEMRLKSPVKDGSDVIVEPGDMLVFVAGHAPIYGTQSLYFRDPVFSERAGVRRPKGNGGLP